MITEEEKKMLEIEREINDRIVKSWSDEELLERWIAHVPDTFGMPKGPEKTELSHRRALKEAARAEIKRRIMELAPPDELQKLKEVAEAVAEASKDASLTRADLARVAAQGLGLTLIEGKGGFAQHYHGFSSWEDGPYTIQIGWQCNPGPTPQVWGFVEIRHAPSSILAKVDWGVLCASCRLAREI